jgi:hypothetical protein
MTRYLHYAIKGPRTQARKRSTNVTEGTSPAFRRGLPNLVSALCLTNLALPPRSLHSLKSLPRQPLDLNFNFLTVDTPAIPDELPPHAHAPTAARDDSGAQKTNYA